jgi:hypothetical protein
MENGNRRPIQVQERKATTPRLAFPRDVLEMIPNFVKSRCTQVQLKKSEINSPKGTNEALKSLWSVN